MRGRGRGEGEGEGGGEGVRAKTTGEDSDGASGFSGLGSKIKVIGLEDLRIY